MNNFDITEISFDGWHVDEVGESIILFFMVPKSYLDYQIPYAGEYRNSAVSAEISLEIPIDAEDGCFGDLPLNELEHFINNVASPEIPVDIDTVFVMISPTIEADGSLTDVAWCEIGLPADDLKQLIELANEELGCFVCI